MEFTWTRTKTIVSICVLVLGITGVLIKVIFFRTVDDKFFQLDYPRLQSAPANMFILRKTHFPDSPRAGYLSAGSSTGRRFVGRNVGLDGIIAAAYECPPSRLKLPTDLPTDHYDFLITTTKDPAEQLRKTVKRKFGYVASWQERETIVWDLKAPSPRLHPNSSGNGRSEFKNGRINFTGSTIDPLVSLAERVLKYPVQDKTGLTGRYDYSILWNWRGFDGMDLRFLETSYAELGLAFSTNSDVMRMMVVEKAR